MKSFANLLSVSCLLLVAFVSFPDQQVQPDAQQAGGKKLELRVNQLEQRVEQLEQVLYSTAEFSIAQAEQRLAETQHTLDASEKLFAKGFINESQLQQDRFNVQQAVQELKLAKTEQRGQKLTGEMDLLNAKQWLTEAKQQLKYTRELARKEFASQFQIQQAENEVNLAERAVKNAELKLKATERIEKIKKNDQ